MRSLARFLVFGSLCSLLVLVVAVASLGSSLSPRRAAAAGSGYGTAGLSRLALGTAASVGTANLPRYGYVLLSPGEVGYIAQIKAASPGTKVLMYQSASEAVDYCSASDMVHCASAVSYQQALAHDQANPSDPWLLYSSAGVAQTMPSYPDSYLMNVGSASLQRQWASLVASKAKSLGFDGVYIDSVLGMIYASSALYPTASAWETAMRSWVAYVGPSLKSQGLYVLTNTFKGGDNDGSLDIAWWTSLAPYVSGLQSEYFEEGPDAATRFDTNPCCWTGHWLNWMKLADAAQQNGADFFTVDKGTATQHQPDDLPTRHLPAGLGRQRRRLRLRTRAQRQPRSLEPGLDDRHRHPTGRALPGRCCLAARLQRRHRDRRPRPRQRTDRLPRRHLHNPRRAKRDQHHRPTRQRRDPHHHHHHHRLTPPSAPVNTALPTLSGSAQQGQNLTASTGSWSGSPTAYSYQWKKCDSAGNNCANIGGETFSGITVSSAYVGSTLRATVTASNAAAPAAPARPPPQSWPGLRLRRAPVNTALPTLSGSAQQGQNLTASTGSWSGSPTAYSYQWKHCDSAGNNCANIGGETFSGITLSSAYVGSTLRATVTASNGSGSGSATSAPSAVVGTAAPGAVGAGEHGACRRSAARRSRGRT